MLFGPPKPPALLPAGWRHLLATALLPGQRPGEFAVAFDRAIADLFALDDRSLAQLDNQLRARFFYSPAHTPDNRVRIESLRDTPEQAQACLFVSACDRSGYVREQALRDFAAYPGRLALSAALIRCDDWVDPVRREAERLLGRLLLQDDSVLFESLDVALRLRMRARFRDGVWTKRIEPSLRSPRHAQARWAMTAHPSPLVREWAYAAIADCDPQLRDDACLAALNDPHPRIALQALRSLSESNRATDRAAHLARATTFAHAAVRTEALRQVQRFGLPNAREQLRSALLDRSAGPRRVAAYLLKTHYGEDAAEHWRQVAAGADSHEARAALASLSDCAQLEDIDLLKRWFAHPTPALRGHALRGLIRAQTPDLQSVLAQATQDRNSRVMKAALAAFASGAAPMTLAILQRGWDRHDDPGYRAKMIATTTLIDKWQALGFLLRTLAENSTPQLQPWIVHHLRDWSYTVRYRFGARCDGDTPPLHDLLNAARPRLPEDLADQILGFIDASPR
ncbi:hypothetical protein [Lysobacter sp. Root690]|uniref:HEAT repeat domain-containing protein n=1 Tax=Lysobacter sp. Root690 TaxID=1736588 RepID=UPI0006F462B5|nr:hypothetical protein [Lysobacter sp. Root690]KRB06658.1 hypothetical protein ASD86_11530 [Lysobacter sp. Root690]